MSYWSGNFAHYNILNLRTDTWKAQVKWLFERKKEKKNKEKAAFSSELNMQISATG